MLDAEGNQNKGGFTCGIKCWMLRVTKSREGSPVVL